MNLIKVVICGQGATGKSTLLQRLSNNSFDNKLEMTIGLDVKKLSIDRTNHEYLDLQCWDLGGQDQFRVFQQDFFKGANIIVLVFAVDWFQSFLNLEEWVSLFPASLDNYQVLLIGNKIDEPLRSVSTDEAAEVAAKYGFQYYEVSSRTGENFDDFRAALYSIADRLVSHHERMKICAD